MDGSTRIVALAGAISCLVAGALGAPASGGASRADRPFSPPVVIAIVEPGGFNVLHSDFRSDSTQRLQLPAGLPRRRMVALSEGTWGEQLRAVQRGVLGAMAPGTVYSIAGTRILGIWGSKDAVVTNIMEERAHGTGTASSAVGSDHGTAPNAWLVFVPDISAAAWRWVARQDWIDVVSTSYTGGPGYACASVGSIVRIAEQGRLVFSAVGNGEQVGELNDPSGVAEAYQVGGVDDQGRPYIPLVSGGFLGTPNRPYETGELFDTEAAHPSSLAESDSFGGTSAAAPRTAGRAAGLIQYARALLGSSGGAPRALANAGPGVARPRSGPLADGDLTAAELTDLLHAVAIPSLPASPLSYLYEGFGALNDDAIAQAERILEGRAEMPERPEDQAIHEQVEAIRASMMERC